MIKFFANIFGYILNFIYNIIGNYGWSIIIFSILIKILMIPISIKQQKTMKKSAKMQVKMKEIQVKYKNNPEKLNEATMQLYKSENMNPFSGCFSAIAQIILLFAVFYLVKSPLTHMRKVDIGLINKYTTIMQQNELSTQSGYPEIELIREIENIKNLKNQENEEEKDGANVENQEDKGQEDKIDLLEINNEEIDSLNINMNFLGLNLAQVPTMSKDWKAYIIPLLYVLTSIISMKITNVATTDLPKKEKEPGKEDEFDPMMQMNKNMSLMMPVMSVMIGLITPLGLALYWLMNSLLMIVERLALNKLLKDEEEE